MTGGIIVNEKIVRYCLLFLFAVLLIGCVLAFSGCGCVSYLKEILDIHEHEYVERLVDPTCESQGYVKHSCTCGSSYNTDYTPALGHTLQNYTGSEATCTKAGKTDGARCIVCNKWVVEQQIIPPLPHTDSEHDGICDVCQTVFEKITPITNVGELKLINSNLNGSYRLENDVSLSSTEWIALGSKTEPFTGKLYGMGHTISDLELTNKGESGLFFCNAGTIEGVKLLNVMFRNDNISDCTVGGFAAYNRGSIVNCSVDGSFRVVSSAVRYESRGYPNYDGTSVSCTNLFGGVCAVNEGTVSDCILSAAFNIEATTDNTFKISLAWGSIDSNWNSTCTSTVIFGCVSGKNLGKIENCTVSGSNHCSATVAAHYYDHGLSTARLNLYVGSLVGINEKTVKSCYAVETVLVKDVGETYYSTGIVKRGVISALNVYDDATYSGLVGQNNGTVNNVLFY